MIFVLIGFVIGLIILGYCLIGTVLLAKMAHFTWRQRHPRYTQPAPTVYPDTAAGRYNRAMDERG